MSWLFLKQLKKEGLGGLFFDATQCQASENVIEIVTKMKNRKCI